MECGFANLIQALHKSTLGKNQSKTDSTMKYLVESYFNGNISYVRSSIVSKQAFANVILYMMQSGLYDNDEIEKFITVVGVK